MTSLVRLRAAPLRAAAFLCFITATGLAAQSATITGKVTDAEGGAPVPLAQVQLTGTSLGAQANEQGVYTIRGAPPGSHQLRVIVLGYSSITRPVTVTAGQSVTVDFALRRAPYQLEAVVTTATGQQLTRELGNNMAKIDAAKLVETAPITNIQDLLNGRSAGVSLLQGSGTVGQGSRIRIRGISSASLSNDPIIVLDGIRIDQSSPDLGGNVYIGGGKPSFFNDLNPQEIESIEIVKGPAASTLYGTQAANGVIVITTKKGKAGPAKWTVFAENGISKDPTDYPDVYYTRGRAPNGTIRNCLQWQAIAGQCTIEQTFSLDLMEIDSTSAIGTGHRQLYGAQVSGGTDASRYFVSAQLDDETGLLKMPDSEVNFLKRERGVTSLPRSQLRPNGLKKTSLRANLGTALSPKADLSVSSGYVSLDNRLVQTGDNLQGVLGAALYGTANPAATLPWGFARPAEGFSKTVTRRDDRFINSANANWRPTSFLSTRANIGLDYLRYNDEAFVPSGQGCAVCGVERTGLLTLNKFDKLNYTVDLGATATFKATTRIGSKTSVGVQWTRENLTGTLNSVNTFPPGSATIDAGTVKTSGDTTAEFRTLGAYFEEQVSLDERLFLTGAVRRDENSAFGQDFGATVYPKVSLSWVVRESYLPGRLGWLGQFRVRGAFGESGQQPGVNSAITYLNPTVTSVFGGLDAPSATLGGLGNLNLKPERSREIEGGFDAGFLRDRLNLSVTYYSKRTEDALINRLLPPSLGAVNSRVENVGVVTNKGVEISVNARVLDTRTVNWDLGIEASENKNKLVSLAPGIPPLTGFGFQNRPGYPLFGAWWQALTGFTDANNNGTIEPSEVTVTDTLAYHGSTVPRQSVTVNTSWGLFGDRLRVQGLLDWRGDFVSHNVNNLFQCAFIQNCEALHVKTASLKEQAKAVAGPRAFGGYFEDATFLKIREFSVTFNVPTRYAEMARTRTASITFTGRNLKTFTDFTSWDPENVTGSNDASNYNFVQLAQPRQFFFRVNLGF